MYGCKYEYEHTNIICELTYNALVRTNNALLSYVGIMLLYIRIALVHTNNALVRTNNATNMNEYYSFVFVRVVFGIVC